MADAVQVDHAGMRLGAVADQIARAQGAGRPRSPGLRRSPPRPTPAVRRHAARSVRHRTAPPGRWRKRIWFSRCPARTSTEKTARADLGIKRAVIAFGNAVEFGAAIGDGAGQQVQPAGGAFGIGDGGDARRQGQPFHQRHDIDAALFQHRALRSGRSGASRIRRSGRRRVRPCPGQERGAHAVGHGAQAADQGWRAAPGRRQNRGRRRRWRPARSGARRVCAGRTPVSWSSPPAPETKPPALPGQAGGFALVGPERFELSTSRPPDGRANQAALRPDTRRYIADIPGRGKRESASGAISAGRARRRPVRALHSRARGKQRRQPARGLGRDRRGKARSRCGQMRAAAPRARASRRVGWLRLQDRHRLAVMRQRSADAGHGRGRPGLRRPCPRLAAASSACSHRPCGPAAAAPRLGLLAAWRGGAAAWPRSGADIGLGRALALRPRMQAAPRAACSASRARWRARGLALRRRLRRALARAHGHDLGSVLRRRSLRVRHPPTRFRRRPAVRGLAASAQFLGRSAARPAHGGRPVRAGSSARRGWSGLRHAADA